MQKMSAESVGSCVGGGGGGAPPKLPLPLPNPRSPFREEQTFSPNTPVKSYKKSTICYHCKQEGHWARECPNKNKESPGPSPGKALFPKCPPNYPELLCKYCQQPCVVRTSRTAANPERDFYTCPRGEACKTMFQWCDEVDKIQSQRVDSPVKPIHQCGAAVSQNPICTCTAGPCRIETRQHGEWKGRKYFACHLKSGQGACEHFEFVDSLIDIKKKAPAASSPLGGEAAANHVGSGSTRIISPNSPEESPSKCQCVDEWKNEYTVSPTFNGYVAANELDIRYDDLLDEEAKSPQMDKGGVKEHIHSEPEETIAPKSLVLPRSLKNTCVPYSPIRIPSFTEDSPRNPTCLVCGGSHETEECIPLELLQEWSL